MATLSRIDEIYSDEDDCESRLSVVGGSVSDFGLALVDVTRDEDDEWILDKGGLRSAARGEEELSAALKTTHTRARALADLAEARMS
jgi:hypothetical protein